MTFKDVLINCKSVRQDALMFFRVNSCFTYEESIRNVIAVFKEIATLCEPAIRELHELASSSTRLERRHSEIAQSRTDRLRIDIRSVTPHQIIEIERTFAERPEDMSLAESSPLLLEQLALIVHTAV